MENNEDKQKDTHTPQQPIVSPNHSSLEDALASLSQEKTDVVFETPTQTEDEQEAEKANPLEQKTVPDGTNISSTDAQETRKKIINESTNQLVGNGTKTKKKSVSQSLVAPLRTYKDDVAQAIKRQSASLISIATAEHKRRADATAPNIANEEHGSLSYKAVGILLLSVVLVLSGIGLASFFIFTTGNTTTVVIEERVTAHIFVEEQIQVDITEDNRSTLMKRLVAMTKEANLPLGSIAQMYFTEEISFTNTGSTEIRIVSIQGLLSKLEVRAPSALLRTLDEHATLGVHAFDGNQPFFILKTSFFDNAFSGMLAWERNMNEDLAPLFGPFIEPRTSVGTSTTTFIDKSFKDEIIRNRDVRVFRNPDGEMALLYTFPSRDTIVITTNEQTLLEVITRLDASRF